FYHIIEDSFGADLNQVDLEPSEDLTEKMDKLPVLIFVMLTFASKIGHAVEVSDSYEFLMPNVWPHRWALSQKRRCTLHIICCCMGVPSQDTMILYDLCPQVVYAWARDAPSLLLPEDVGFLIGKDSPIKYLVLQVHYMKRFPSTLVSGYVVHQKDSGDEWRLLGKKNPQLPQMFYPVEDMSPIGKGNKYCFTPGAPHYYWTKAMEGFNWIPDKDASTP
ncbi:Uncharacterized protein OBRU01_03039, partial [Operophtera brumata]